MSENWISRTKGGPLTISLRGIDDTSRSNSFSLLLREPRISSFSTAARNCTVLSIACFPSSSKYLKSAFLEKLDFPSLEVFKVHVYVDTETCRTLFTLAAPNLKELDVTNAGIIVSGSSPQLSTFRLFFDDNAISVMVFVSLRLVFQENRVRILRLHGNSSSLLTDLVPEAEEHLFFNNVRTIEVADFSRLRYSGWIQDISWDRLNFPLVSEFRLLFSGGQRFFKVVIQALVSAPTSVTF